MAEEQVRVLRGIRLALIWIAVVVTLFVLTFWAMTWDKGIPVQVLRTWG